MLTSLNYIQSQQHLADLRTTADRHRLVRSAGSSTPSTPRRLAQIRHLLHIRTARSSSDTDRAAAGTATV